MNDNSKVQALVDRLVGTCQSGADEIEDLTTQECREFDEKCFCCEDCGWWFETCDEHDGKCSDCAKSAA
jgi:hypothetical protein